MQLSTKVGIVICAALVSLFWVSYDFASNRADALISKVRALHPHQYERTGSRLAVIRSITGHSGPTWEFSYDPDDFGTSDVTLEVNLWGDVIGSNPPSALSKLRLLP